jgi:predicted HicB family RNase H-like nuclease
MEYKGYTARVEFDEHAGVLFGEVEGLRDVITFEATNVDDLISAFHDSVDDYLAMCAERGEDPERPYSGKFLVRVDPRLHREVSMAAARTGKSLNQFTTDLLRDWLDRARATSVAEQPPTWNVAQALEEALSVFPTPSPEPARTSPPAVAQSRATVWRESSHDTPSSRTPNTPNTPRRQEATKPAKGAGPRKAAA